MERRKAARREVAADEPLSHARLRTGGQLLVLDASAWGALTECTERLLPGRRLDVHVISVEGRVLVRSCVARAFVCRLAADAVHYRAALAFDRAIDVRADGYQVPARVLPPDIPRGSDYPQRIVSGDIEFAEPLST